MTILRPGSNLRRSWVGKQKSNIEKEGGKVPFVEKESSKQSAGKVRGGQSSVEKVGGNIPSLEKEGSKQSSKQSSVEKVRGGKSSVEKVGGNQPSTKKHLIQPSGGALREPSKRKASKQHDPMYAYQQYDVQNEKRKVAKQHDPPTPPSEKAKASSYHSSKKNKVSKQADPTTPPSEKDSSDHLRKKKKVAKQPDPSTPPSERTPSDHSSGISSPLAKRAIAKLISQRKTMVPRDGDDEYEHEKEVDEQEVDEQEVDEQEVDEQEVDEQEVEVDDHEQEQDEQVDEEDEDEDDDENELEYEDEHEQEEEDEHEQEGEADDEVSDESETDDSSADEEEAAPERRRKHRGRTKIRQNADFRKRPKLYVIGDRAFKSIPHDTKIVSTIAQLVTRNAKGAYRSYGEFPNSKKEECLRAFLMKYRWGKHEDHTRCSQVFHRIADSRYSNVLTGVRRDVAKKAQSSEPSSWKPFTPSWFTSKVWATLCDKWSSPEWRKKSTQMRENRLKGGVKVYHRHGSSNSYSRAISMENKLKRRITFTEVYVDTHMSKDKKEFLTERAGTTLENYNKLMTEKWGENKKRWPSIDEEVWFHASGGKKHGHFFGVPSLMNSSKLPGGRCSQYPVMGNILPSDTNRVSSQSSDYYDDEDDDPNDVDYIPGMESEDEPSFEGPGSQDQIMFDSDYDEASFDYNAPSSDDDEVTLK